MFATDTGRVGRFIRGPERSLLIEGAEPSLPGPRRGSQLSEAFGPIEDETTPSITGRITSSPNETAAQADYQIVKDLRARGLVGSHDAAIVTKDASGKARLVVVGESKSRRQSRTQ